MTQLLPFTAYPSMLNALRVIDQVAPASAEDSVDQGGQS